MALAERSAETTWEGDTKRGSGLVTFGTSGLARELPISLPTRTGEAEGNTSPEELIAAAHSGCYAMALSALLTKQGNPPERLDVSANVTLERSDGGLVITRSDLTVRGSVPGLSAEQFEQAAREGEQACPVSNVLRGNAEIGLEVSVEG